MKVTLKEFKERLQADLSVRGNPGIILLAKDPIARFHFYLRLVEFLQNKTALLPFYIFIKYLFLRISRSLSFSIPPNTLGKGVYLPHWGTIVVNSKAYVSDYSVINTDVVIGRHPSSKSAVPFIGKGVYIGPGVKVFGKVNVGNNCLLGANAVVTKSVDKASIVVGIPGKIVGTVTQAACDEYGLKYFDEK